MFGYHNKPNNYTEQNINNWQEAYHHNLIPMYGRVKKSEEEQAIDKAFTNSELQAYHDTIIAAKHMARIGWYYFFHKKMDTAMFRFNQSWLIDSNYPASYFGFAAIREYQGLMNESEYYYKLAYMHDKSDTLSLQNLHTIADIKEQQHDTIGLIKAYERLFYKFPKDGNASAKLGYFYSTQHQPDSALKYYNISININPDYFQNYINRGWIYLKSGNVQKAIDDFSIAINKNSASISAYANRYYALMSVKRYREALEDINKCIELDPNASEFYLDRVKCKDHLNQK